MSNIATPKIVGRRHLLHCAGVALAFAAAFIIVSMPKPDTAAASTTDNRAKAACLQSWPYYEHSCLHDSRQRDGDARAVRVIAINAHHASGR
jgi:hypothetical protein